MPFHLELQLSVLLSKEAGLLLDTGVKDYSIWEKGMSFAGERQKMKILQGDIFEGYSKKMSGWAPWRDEVVRGKKSDKGGRREGETSRSVSW